MTDIEIIVDVTHCEICSYGTIRGAMKKVRLEEGPAFFICLDCVGHINNAPDVEVEVVRP